MYFQFTGHHQLQNAACTLYSIQSTVISLFVVVVLFCLFGFIDVYTRAWQAVASYIDDNKPHLKDMHAQPTTVSL